MPARSTASSWIAEADLCAFIRTTTLRFAVAPPLRCVAESGAFHVPLHDAPDAAQSGDQRAPRHCGVDNRVPRTDLGRHVGRGLNS
jgi:hypothetical protein